MTVTYLRADVLRAVHGLLIETYGALGGIRDAGVLVSAVARPQQIATYAEETRIGALGAALAWAALRNHPFVDGNKRVALAALVMFLELNGHRLTCSEAEETAMVLRAAGSEISEGEWVEWVLGSVASQ